jgi:hypothetical protein
MFIVLYTVKTVYICVFMTCCTSYCCETLTDPRNVCIWKNWVLNIFHLRAFGKLNTVLLICIYSLDGGLNQLKTCSLYKLMVLINAVNAHILLLNTPLLLLFFAQARACSNSVAMQPPEGALVHIKHNGCKSQKMLHISWRGQYSHVKGPG